MIAWDETLPYNAVHAVSIRSCPDEELLRGAIHRSLAACGFECDPDAIPIARMNGEGDDLAGKLRLVFESELNKRFDRSPTAIPFRFFWIPDRPNGSEETFVLGVCYYHPIAGADCVCWLLEDIVSCFIEPETGGLTNWHAPRSPRYRIMVLRQWRYFSRWITSARPYFRQAKRYARLEGSHRKGAGSRVHAITLSSAQQKWIRHKMGSTGATFNDVLVGLVLYGIAKEIPDRFTCSRRKDLAIGSIINIRNHFGQKHRKTFDVLLAMFSVSHPMTDLDSLDDLFRSVREQTAAIKENRYYLRNLFLLSFGNFWNKFLTEDKRANVSIKNFPLAAGVTNFYVDRFQTRMSDLPVDDYWRGVSASPSTPLVISATTFGEQMNLMFIRNESFYSGPEIDSLILRLESLMDDPG
tara:strand:- start:2627 stop:3859 length:1233 start_codon:yes stop_codon:yes gene_type:complete